MRPLLAYCKLMTQSPITTSYIVLLDFLCSSYSAAYKVFLPYKARLSSSIEKCCFKLM
jgi:hypothetical protein